MGLEKKRSCLPHNVRKFLWLESEAYERVVAFSKAHPTEGRGGVHATVRQASRRGRDKRRRVFKEGHVQRWRRGMKRASGCLIQIDYMSLYSNGKVLKHFNNAVCPVTRVVVSRAFSSASKPYSGRV